ncbi:MAG TPA: PEGA domain-containing protein [Terriglobia bacterium]|nr:PEGA domain-containing protein [Terriglobia bacterium]
MTGKDITIPKGTEITVYINGDMPIDPSKFTAVTSASPAAGSPAAPPAGQPPDASAASGAQPPPAASDQLASVGVASQPAGADITVDGKYVGSTPSTVKLTPGDHLIKIEKSGFKARERTITVSSGSEVTVSTTLEKP